MRNARIRGMLTSRNSNRGRVWPWIPVLTAGVLGLYGCGQKPATVKTTPPKMTLYGLQKSGSIAAQVLDKKDQPIPGLPINWASSQTKVASVENGIVKSVGAGKTIITAEHAGFSGTSTVEVIDVKTITVSPPRTTLAGKKGDTVSFVAEVLDTKDHPTDLKPKWATTDANIATVDDNGTVTALAEGRVSVSATLGEIGGSADLRILFREIDTFIVHPTLVYLPTGGVQTLNVIAKSPDGVAIDDVAVVYASSDPKTAVASGGKVRAFAKGSTTIKATCGPRTAEIVVIVENRDAVPAAPGK